MTNIKTQTRLETRLRASQSLTWTQVCQLEMMLEFSERGNGYAHRIDHDTRRLIKLGFIVQGRKCIPGMLRYTLAIVPGMWLAGDQLELLKRASDHIIKQWCDGVHKHPGDGAKWFLAIKEAAKRRIIRTGLNRMIACKYGKYGWQDIKVSILKATRGGILEKALLDHAYTIAPSLWCYKYLEYSAS